MEALEGTHIVGTFNPVCIEEEFKQKRKEKAIVVAAVWGTKFL